MRRDFTKRPKMGVREVVFVDRGGDDRAPMISVRGVQTESGRVHVRD